MKKNIEAIECDLCHTRWIEEGLLPKAEHALLVKMVRRTNSIDVAEDRKKFSFSFRDLCNRCFIEMEGAIKNTINSLVSGAPPK